MATEDTSMTVCLPGNRLFVPSPSVSLSSPFSARAIYNVAVPSALWLFLGMLLGEFSVKSRTAFEVSGTLLVAA